MPQKITTMGEASTNNKRQDGQFPHSAYGIPNKLSHVRKNTNQLHY